MNRSYAESWLPSSWKEESHSWEPRERITKFRWLSAAEEDSFASTPSAKCALADAWPVSDDQRCKPDFTRISDLALDMSEIHRIISEARQALDLIIPANLTKRWSMFLLRTNRSARYRMAGLALGMVLFSACQGCLKAVPDEQGLVGSLELSGGSAIDLGHVATGGRREKFFWLTNPTSRAIEVSDIEASCTCVKVMLPARTVYPRERVGGNVVLNLIDESAVSGPLAIKVAANEPSGGLAFAITVYADVD